MTSQVAYQAGKTIETARNQNGSSGEKKTLENNSTTATEADKKCQDASVADGRQEPLTTTTQILTELSFNNLMDGLEKKIDGSRIDTDRYYTPKIHFAKSGYHMAQSILE